MKDPFRRGIGHAVQWYDNLQGQLNDIADQALKAADETITAIKLVESQSSPMPHPHASPGVRLEDTSMPQLSRPHVSSGVSMEDTPTVTASKPRVECNRLLQQRCPACFAAVSSGRAVNQ